MIKEDSKKGRIQKCSVCGKISEYTQKELDEVFPFSRELLKCKHGNHPLSSCSGIVLGKISKKEIVKSCADDVNRLVREVTARGG